MDNIQKLTESFQANTKIDENTKGNLEYLISVFQKRFPGVSLDNFCERLKTLQVVRGSKYVFEEATQYNPKDNTIVINQGLLQQEKVDARHSMMKTLLSIITAKDLSYGFATNRSLEALNVGFCEIVANNLVGNEGESSYEDEQILVNSIGSSIGLEPFIDAFFTNNSDLLMTKLFARCGSSVALDKFLSQANHNMHTRKQMGTSRLFALQQDAYLMFGSGYDFIMNKRTMEETIGLKYPESEKLEQLSKTDLVETMKR